MNYYFRPGLSSRVGALLIFGTMPFATQALVGVHEAAVSLERQLSAHPAAAVTQSFGLPLSGSEVVLSGVATLESLLAGRCRRTVELIHDKPFERRGLRITNLSRRSVQDGPCTNFAEALAAQANASARSIAEQIGLAEAAAAADTPPGTRVLVASAPAAAASALSSNSAADESAAPLSLMVLERAIIRDAPSREGKKLSRADAGAQFKGSRIAGHPDWFLLADGRYISATVVQASADTAASPALPVAVLLTVREKAIIRDAPDRRGEKLSRADVGTRLKAWRIPDNANWFVLDGGLRFISATVVNVADAAPLAPASTIDKADFKPAGGSPALQLTVAERAVLRNAPSFKGQKVATLAVGVERLARKVPGVAGWFELIDSESRYPLYIHQSVVTQKPSKSSDKRL